MDVERILAGDRSAWLKRRERDVTASGVAALFGVHPYLSPFAHWAHKTGRLKDILDDDGPVKRGRLLEPVAVEMLREQHPTWKITHNSGAGQVYLRDPSIRLGATPDVFAHDRRRGVGIVQIKSVQQSVFRREWVDEDGNVTAPLWIAIQALTEAHLSGAEWACIAALVVDYGISLSVVDVPIHRGVIERIRRETVKFWEMVERGEEPSIDYAADYETLSRVYGDEAGTEIDLSSDNRIQSLLEERENAKTRIARATADVKALDAELIEKLGPHERAFVPGWSVSRPLVRRNGFTVEPTEYRALRVKCRGDRPKGDLHDDAF